jgi:hypothetical protein
MQPTSTPNTNSKNYMHGNPALDPFSLPLMIPLYALADGCQVLDWIHGLREKFGQEARMLFQGPGTVYHEIEEVAPYLCSLDPENALLSEWFGLHGSNAGVLIASDVPMSVLYTHLRNVFVAKDSNDQDYFFRFYDPRVLRGFLPAARPEEVCQFFGPIRWMIVEDIGPASLIAYTHDQGKLRTQRLTVSYFLEQFDLPKSL